MARKHNSTLKQLRDEAERHAQFYFDHPERAQMLRDAGRSADAVYIVLIKNRFVPLQSLDGCEGMLRNFVSGKDLCKRDSHLLKKYWSLLDAARLEIAKVLETSGSVDKARTIAKEAATWPAVAVAASKEEMRSVLTYQFQIICRDRIAWRGVDSSTCDSSMKGGVYVLVDWFWHGA